MGKRPSFREYFYYNNERGGNKENSERSPLRNLNRARCKNREFRVDSCGGEALRTLSITTITRIRREWRSRSRDKRQGPIWIVADAPEITFQRWCRNNGASGRDRRDFRARLCVSQGPADRREKKVDDLVSDSDRRRPDLSSDILKRLRDSSQHRGVAES